MAIESQIRLYTVDEFEALLDLPENKDRLLELINGEIVEKVPTEEHSQTCGNIYYGLRQAAEKDDLGRVGFEVRRRAPDDDRNARLPDVDFVSKARLNPVVKKGAAPQMPDLAVEVKSRDDSIKELRAKAEYYLSKGVRLVWLVYPHKRFVEVYSPDADVQILTEKDVLDGGDVLPGFAMPVADIFASI